MTDMIRRLLQEHGRLHTPVASLADDADLYQAGLTPFAAIRTMLAIEDAYDVEFPVEMLRRQSFISIRAIENCLSQILPAGQTLSAGDTRVAA